MTTPLDQVKKSIEEVDVVLHDRTDHKLFKEYWDIIKDEVDNKVKKHLLTSQVALLESVIEKYKESIGTKDHYCAYNDGEQTCECYTQCLEDQITYLTEQITKIKEL